MGKKKVEEMVRQRSVFKEGSAANNIDPELSMKIFDLVEKFAGYGFNKSHSAAYALVSYQTLWMKTHFPSEFMAAVMSADMDNTDKVVMFIEDCGRLNITVHPPDINNCQYHFTVNSDGSLRYGLGAIKGVGEAAIQAIINVRSDQPFSSLIDFCKRVDTFRVNRRTLEVLVFSGAFDAFNQSRAVMLASLDDALSMTEQNAQAQTRGQNDLFAGLDEVASLSEKHFTYQSVSDWTDTERLKHEKSVLGLYLSGHPITTLTEELKAIGVTPLNKLEPNKAELLAAGYVLNVRTKLTRKGQKIAFITLDDAHSRLELSLFSEAYTHYRPLIAKDTLLIVRGEVVIDEFNGNYKMKADSIYTLDQARNHYGKGLQLHIDYQNAPKDFTQRLKSTLQPFTGGTCPITICYQGQHASGNITLGSAWQVTITQNLLNTLVELCHSPKNIKIIY